MKKIKVLLDFFQKIVGFQRATPLVAFRRKRNPYALRAFLLLFAIEKEAEFEAVPHKLPQQFAKVDDIGRPESPVDSAESKSLQY